MILVVQPHPPFIRTSIWLTYRCLIWTEDMMNFSWLVGPMNIPLNHHVSWLNPLKPLSSHSYPISIAIPFLFTKPLYHPTLILYIIHYHSYHIPWNHNFRGSELRIRLYPGACAVVSLPAIRKLRTRSLADSRSPGLPSLWYPPVSSNVAG